MSKIRSNKGFAAYKRRKRPEVEDLLARQLKILDVHLSRHELELFSEELFDQVNKIGKWSAAHAAQAKELSVSAARTAELWLRVQKVAKMAAAGMTFEEELETFIDWASDIGRNHKYKFWRAIHALEHQQQQEGIKTEG